MYVYVHSYSKSDNQRICDSTNFDINAVIRFEPKKGGRAGSYSYIVIHRTYLEQVQKIVLPHLSPFFYYKVGLAPPRSLHIYLSMCKVDAHGTSPCAVNVLIHIQVQFWRSHCIASWSIASHHVTLVVLAVFQCRVCNKMTSTCRVSEDPAGFWGLDWGNK